MNEPDVRYGRVRRMTREDLPRVLQWRNHPDVRRYMYTQHEITLEEHQAWFARNEHDPARHLLVYEDEWGGCGFVHFHAPGNARIAEWGFYLAPDAARGAGRRLGHAALDYGFSVAGFHKVWGEALAYNDRSIRFHESLGFRQEGVLRDQYFDGQAYHAIVRFGLLHHEWPGTST
ncbi:UDP-4-amino-4,6-dideoxy-N-acetyl-beta-L-altrosamine N-acetyltransferase [Caldimonas thermodepolymerans]|jgi:pseudaminic acid biosynthesis N-acetyl transferase|uniref:UDP-4-amino-4, 6-dideoxy-N-acetyl-beta-L-altrosamine N-acetyltransferase n=1 Tax=Caldimonas thermodepolymerans TaxID=215580 RepID=A0AA46DBM4_9BURK|nr:UDP-4-amino-4,6-dideoxy-N-acetyl-beta-L-altrosamine N-acetyltransferase [Caldimonas thermodepolymerans]TCP04916.1 UDP-4-amino-4,6-dideoxy-N-acetyl-beta-L-altrosamine N-acetyltransferase [Caldimonas thermodepolymerans]UZG48292.1 UDP-4-amino-4,6-dideoxy-N-acetyl-beta-L-altrosamine N-acetyltransferase [Caldimonas thermodepolymerans]